MIGMFNQAQNYCMCIGALYKSWSQTVTRSLIEQENADKRVSYLLTAGYHTESQKFKCYASQQD